MAEVAESSYTAPKVGDPCPYCGQILIECETCNGGKAEWYFGNCDDCQGGYGVTCPEPPQDDRELFGHLYCTRHGCKLWREGY